MCFTKRNNLMCSLNSRKMYKPFKNSRSNTKLVKANRQGKVCYTFNKSVVLNIMVFLLLYLLKGIELLLSRRQKSQCRPNGAYFSE